MKKWELNWLAIRRGAGGPRRQRDSTQGGGKTQPVVQAFITWRRGWVTPLPNRSGFQIPKKHIHSVARLRLGCRLLNAGRGRWERGRNPFACIRCQQPDLQPEVSLMPDTEYHALFVCIGTY
jgi:hypothetical protein